MHAITCTEGSPFRVDPRLAQGVRLAGARLQRQLRPNDRPIQEEEGSFVVRGVVGTIDIGGALLEVTPKTQPENDWIAAVLDLISGKDRIQPAGQRTASSTARRAGLLDALASLYATLLETAINRDGPLLLLERHQHTSRRLKGKLNVTEWTRRAAWKPHVFPVSRGRLSVHNDFCRAMAFVCDTLGTATTSPDTRRFLVQFASLLCPEPWQRYRWSPSVVSRVLPSQWAAFKPAWDVCTTILSRRSPLGAKGLHHGVSIAIEAWPLLETLLERALEASLREVMLADRRISIAPKAAVLLLRDAKRSAEPRYVVPDGRLVEAGKTIATFEAKYKQRNQKGALFREDMFQALCTAAACGSPLAVLVYPDSFDPTVWEVPATAGHPKRLAVIGLDLYAYRRGLGDETRGKVIADLLTQ